MFWFRPTMIVIGCIYLGMASALPSRAEDKVEQRRNADGGIQDGWEQVIEIPAFKTPTGETVLRSAKVTLWVEQGWLSVRRNDSDGAVEWQVALVQPIKDTIPVLAVDKAIAGLDLSYDKYFIRDNIESLRVLRQRKDSDFPRWPTLSLKDPLPHNFGSASWRAKLVEIKGWRHNNWCWAMSGLPEDRYDVWLKLEHTDLSGRGTGFASGPKPPRMFYGNRYAIDDGELFFAERSLPDLADKAAALQNLRKEFTQHIAPPIVASQWFNSPASSSLEMFRGKVVLIDFWGTWCSPCVENLPKIEALHKKYEDRGLVVIGVHSEQGGEGVPAFLKKRPLSFPIAIDTGETVKGYGIESWPTYFLIDKSGKSPWGFSSAPPSAEQIETLLR